MKNNGFPFLMFVLRSGISAAVLAASLTAGAAPLRGAGGAMPVDRTWAGIPVNLSAVSVGSVVYVGYYDAERQLSVARIDTTDGDVQKQTVDSVFAGWDAHNSITLKYDHDGILHMSGNMHAAPLVYARMFAPNDFDSFKRVRTMVGKDEAQVTYPKFFDFQDGQLGFTYRSGKSGDGAEIVNKFDGKSWRRYLQTPVFAAEPGGEPVNAYHTGYIDGPDGYFHVAWVWRLSAGVQNNFNVNYAKSKDLKTWFDSKGRPLKIPLTPANTDLVDKIAPGAGLFNNVRLGFNASGQPVISYVKFDEDGNTQLYHARPVSTGWQVAKVSDWDVRWDFSGGGTKVQDITFSGIVTKDGKVTETVKHVKKGNLQITYAADGVTPVRSVSPSAPLSRVCSEKPWVKAEALIAPTSSDSFKGRIVWRAFPPGNADRPRTCQQMGLKAGCDMTSELMVVPAKAAAGDASRVLACGSESE